MRLFMSAGLRGCMAGGVAFLAGTVAPVVSLGAGAEAGSLAQPASSKGISSASVRMAGETEKRESVIGYPVLRLEANPPGGGRTHDGSL
ncbi:hypothetical protein JUNP479_4200 [Aeromonas jandaei]|nr:hypothetical protein JUNP479_4200 [Aeromonas jandaei]